VDLYSGCDSDATSNKIVAMEKRCYCESIGFFCSVATIVFSSCCFVIFIAFFFMILDDNYSAMVVISLKS
jgi:hypothetical protein